MVPVRTNPSLPWAINHLASSTDASTSREPSSANGVTIAGITLPNLALMLLRVAARCCPH